MSRLFAVLLLVLVARPAMLVGQTASAAAALVPGARVRIAQPGQESRVGTLVARAADTLLVQWPEFANAVAVPHDAISRLDVSTGRHRNVVKGAVIGVAAGGAAGFILGAASYQPCTSNCIFAPSNAGESGTIGGIVGGTLGLVVGSLVGLSRVDDWKRVPLQAGRAPATIGLRASGRGIGVGLAF